MRDENATERRTRSLFVLRHGKSDWKGDSQDDHARPLAKRGRKAARLVGRVLSRMELEPQRVLTSSARRAHATVELAAEAGGWSSPIEVCPGLYESDPDSVLDIIREQGDAVQRLMAVGHQPTWSLLASGLIGKANLRFPTAAVARIDFEAAGWREVGYGSGELVWLLTPRLLRELCPEG